MTKLSSYAPFIDIIGNKSFCSNASVAFTYSIELPEVYSLSEVHYDILNALWYNAIKGLPSDSIFIKQDIVLKKDFDSSGFPEDNFLQKETKQHFNRRKCMKHSSYIHFVFNKKNILKNDSIKSPFAKPFKERDITLFDSEVNAFEKEIESLAEYLNNSGLVTLRKADKKEIESISEKYYNGFNDFICDTIRKNNQIFIGDKQIGAYTINSSKRLPESVSTCVENSKMSGQDYTFFRGFAEPLVLDLEVDHVYTQILFATDHYRIKDNLKSTRKDFDGASGFSTDNEIFSEQLKDFEKDMAKDEKIRLMYAHYNVVFFAETANEFEDAKTSISTTFRELDIKPYYPTGKQLQNIFYNTYFSNVANLDLDNAFVIDLQKATTFFNNITTYKDDKEGILFTDRKFNVPVRRDIWDEDKKRITAKNFMVISPTGGGKSFLCNHIIRQLKDSGFNMVINDLGDSYQKLGLLYPEDVKIIRFEPGKPLGINPFRFDYDNITTEIITNLIEFIKIPWVGEGDLTKEDRVSLGKILRTYYQNNPPSPSFQSFYQFVDINKDELADMLNLTKELFDFDRFLHNLSDFAEDGTYEFLFRDEENDDYSTEGKQIVIFEYSLVQSDPLLLSCVLLLSNITAQKNIWSDRTKKSLLFYDEFGKQLKYKSVLDTVAYTAQTIRKYNGMLGLVLQTPGQLPQNEELKAMVNTIVQNTSVFYCLKSEKGYEEHRQILGFADHHVYQMKSLSNRLSGKHKYSEVFQLIGNFGNVVRVEVPEAVQCAYLTEGTDHTKIMNIYEQTKNMEKAIYQFINERHHA